MPPSSLFYPYNQKQNAQPQEKEKEITYNRNPDIGWIHRNYRREIR